MMEASLTCAVCLGLFEEPVTLPLCSHNFCRRCVQGCTSSPPVLPQQLCCPLCRKVSSVPGGAARLPVNTTLAEVVKLLRSTPCKEKEDVAVGAGPCLLHSGRQLMLYCRMCHEGVCGQCVSEHHQGPFHSINLLDITYQQEKLAFFSILKKLREVGEKLSNEISEDPNDIEAVLQNETEIVTSKFDEISKMLDLKRKELLDYISNQGSRKKKEHQLWKEMKNVDNKAVINLLQECEKIVDECDPQSFLKVACDLNRRMNTKIELLHVSSTSVAAQQFKPSEIDIKPALDAIATLKLTTEDHFRDPFSKKQNSNKKFTFKTSTKRWKENIDVSEKFCPVPGQDISVEKGCIHTISVRHMSISEMHRYQPMSHEELRLKYYNNHRQVTNDVTIDSVPGSKNGSSLLPEREPKSNPGIFDEIPTPVKARRSGKGRSALAWQRSFDKSSKIGSSVTSVSKIYTKISETNQKGNELFASRQDSVQMLENGFSFGKKETTCITHSPDQTPSEKSSIQMPERDAPFVFTSISAADSTSVELDHQSSTKEEPMNVSVHPHAHGDENTTNNNGRNVPEHCGTLFTGSACSSPRVAVPSSGQDKTTTDAAVAKANFSFSVGDSKSCFSSCNSTTQGNVSFSITKSQPLTPVEESAKVKIRIENGGFNFRGLKKLTPDSKSPNSKTSTFLEGITEMDADVKKISAPSAAGKNTSSFYLSNCATKPQSTSGISFGSYSKDNSFTVPFTLLPSPNVSLSSKLEKEKDSEHLSSVALCNDETSFSAHSAIDAGLESNSLFPQSGNISKKPSPPCASFTPVFSTMQSTFARETNLFSFHPVVTPIRPQSKVTIKDNGTISPNSEQCSNDKSTTQSQNTLDSVVQIQAKALPQPASLFESLRVSPKKEICQLVPLKEDSVVNEGIKGTSSSDCSGTSDDESFQLDGKLVEDNHSIGDKR
ncbi:uncharacterized protein [Pleurodeles waltl]